MRLLPAIRPLCACAVFVSAAVGQIRVKSLLELEGETSDPSLSSDGQTLVFDWCKPDSSCGLYTRPLAGGPVTLFAGRDSHDGYANSPRWSPDGQSIAFTRMYSHWDVKLVVRGVPGRPERDFDSVCWGQVTWSPDSRFIVASRQFEAEDCRPTLYSATTGQRVRQLAPSGRGSVVSPDGRMLAYADGKVLKLLRLTADYRPSGPATTLAREPNEITFASWSRDGTYVNYQCWGDLTNVRRVAVQPAARPRTVPGLTADVAITEILGDGSALGTESTQVEALWRADLQSKPLKMETVPDAGCAEADLPGCSPDKRLQAFVKMQNGSPEIWIANTDTTNERPLVKSIPTFVNPPDDAVPMIAGWSPDGKWIALTTFPAHGNADTRSYLYIVPASGGPLRRLAKDAYDINNPIWSRDSRSLYGSGEWRTGELATSQPLVRIEIVDGKITKLPADGMSPQVSRDGKILYFFTRPRPLLSRIRTTAGAAEERLWDKENLLWFSYAVGTRYVYLFREPQETAGRKHTLVRFQPDTRETVALAEVAFQPRSAYLSHDERFLYFAQQESPKRRVVLVHGLF